MHDTAAATGAAFFRVYGRAGACVLDVGSADVNGTLRPYAPPASQYIGVDREPGPGVDIVNPDPYALPFADGSFDLVVSTSCLEHDPVFWVTFAEMARVAKPGGFLYVSAPVNGPVHRHPWDCWRFYPDAAMALAGWASHCNEKLTVVESFLVPPQGDVWQDFVAVFAKPAPGGEQGPPQPERDRIMPLFPEAIDCRGDR